MVYLNLNRQKKNNFYFSLMTNEKQKKYDVAYLRIAQEWGKLSYCKRRQVGAIIVKNGMIIS